MKTPPSLVSSSTLSVSFWRLEQDSTTQGSSVSLNGIGQRRGFPAALLLRFRYGFVRLDRPLHRFHLYPFFFHIASPSHLRRYPSPPLFQWIPQSIPDVPPRVNAPPVKNEGGRGELRWLDRPVSRSQGSSPVIPRKR